MSRAGVARTLSICGGRRRAEILTQNFRGRLIPSLACPSQMFSATFQKQRGIEMIHSLKTSVTGSAPTAND